MMTEMPAVVQHCIRQPVFASQKLQKLLCFIPASDLEQLQGLHLHRHHTGLSPEAEGDTLQDKASSRANWCAGKATLTYQQVCGLPGFDSLLCRGCFFCLVYCLNILYQYARCQL
jgi:hypothetical protein